MTKLSLKYWGLPVAFALGTLAAPASADVFVTATVTKNKDVTVTETITKTKDVTVNVTFDEELTGAAEALAVANITNTGNVVDDARGDPEDSLNPFGLDFAARIVGSVNDNSGVVHFNQDVGSMVNQGNSLALAAVGPSGEEGSGSFTDSQAAVDQVNTDNQSRWVEDIGSDPANPILTPHKVTVIRDSINGNSGVIGVNQNAGDMNNQTNAVSLAVGIDARLALSEGMLGQVNSGNHVDEVETIRDERIVNSGTGNSGVVSVNQSSGNMNNQGSVVAFSALTSSATINVPNP